MIKTNIGQLDTPFFEQKLDNGLKVIFIPKKSQEKSILLYVSQGTFLHDLEIDNCKMSYGVSYLLEKVISSSIKDQIRDEEAILTSASDYSYSYYRIDSFKDIFKPFSLLLNKIVNIDFDESDIERVKKGIIERSSELKTSEKCYRACLNNLYLKSQIKLDSQPKASDMIPLHYSTLKKFLLKYYVPSRIAIIISGDYTPSEVMKEVEKFKFLNDNFLNFKPLSFKEDYTKTLESEGRLVDNSLKSDYLSFGVKFLAREQLFNKYGQYMFYVYEVIEDLLFNYNEDFKKSLIDLDSSLLSTSLKEGDEDCFLMLTFKTFKPHSLLSYLKNYFSLLDKRVSKKELRLVKENYFTSSVISLSTPSTITTNFAKAYSNNLPYTGLVTYTSKMDYNSLVTFLKDMSTFPFASYIIERE